MLDLLLHTSPEPIFIYDFEDLKFLEVNPAALSIYGYSYEEFLKMDLTDLYDPDDIQTLLDSSNAKNKEKVFTGPWKHKKRNGESILVEISKLSFIYKGKKAHFNIVRDVTEKIKLLNESRIFHAAFNNVDDLIFITDTEGFIQQINQSVNSTLNYSTDELINLPFPTLLPDTDRTSINTSVFLGKSQKITKLNSEVKKKDGAFEKGEIIFTPIFDFNNQLILINIIFKPEKIAGRITVPPKESSKDNKEIQKQKESTVDFSLLSCMFHEILTPINVILGFLQEVTDSIEQPSSEQKEAIDIIDQNRAILLQSMNEILEYSQLETQEIEITPKNVTIPEILDTVHENTKKLADKHHIELLYGKISSSLVIETDLHKLETLVTLLVSISMNFTKEKTIFLSASQNDDQNCIIGIKDAKGNISIQLLEKLKEVFLNPDDDIYTDRGVSRVTVGLAKKLLKLLSGKAEVINRPEGPAEFGFMLPLKYVSVDIVQKQERNQKGLDARKNIVENASIKETPFSVSQPAPVQQKPAEPVRTEQKPQPKPLDKIEFPQMRCLYIEDQVDSQTLFKVQMKDLKEIDFAFNFDLALPLLHAKTYDFIVIDINLQGQFNGIEVLKMIRSLPGFTRMPIIAVTAYLLPGDKEKFIASGFNGFVAKPILRNKLMDVLERAILMP